MTKWLSLVSAVLALATGFLALAQQKRAESQPVSGVYLCQAVESPEVILLEGVGPVRLIGVRAVAGSTANQRTLSEVRRLIEQSLVKLEICPKRPRDNDGRIRGEIFFLSNGEWKSLNQHLLSSKLVQPSEREDCHVDPSRSVNQAEGSSGFPAPRIVAVSATGQMSKGQAGAGGAPASLSAGDPMRRVRTVRARATFNPKQAAELGWRTISVPSALRVPLEQAEQNMVQTAGVVAALREVLARIDILERALLPIASKARLTPERISMLLLRGNPPTIIASDVSGVIAPLGGEPMPQRLIRLGMLGRREPLSEVLNWFPEIRDSLLQSLRALGAQMVGGVAGAPAPVGGAGPSGAGAPGPGAVPGMMGPMMGGAGGGLPQPPRGGAVGAPGAAMPMMGGPMGGPPAGGPPMAMGLPEEERAAGGFGPPGGAPGMMPGMMGAPGVGAAPAAAPAGAAAAGNFHRYLAIAREGLVPPEYAGVLVLALRAYRDQVQEQYRQAVTNAHRARQEWAEIHQIVVGELRKLSSTLR